jgi:predicted Zn-dependent protease
MICLHQFFLKIPIVLSLTICLLIVLPCRILVADFTIEDEKKVGREFYEKLEKNNALVKDVKVNKYINDLGQSILSKVKNPLFDFTFSVIRSSAINAFATPGGYVYINRGLISLTENESQLASVLAHEIAHVNARHIASIISKSQKVNIATLAAILAGAFLGGGGEVTAAVMGFSLATATHLSLKYSREHEEEADRLGITYLAAADYKVTETINFLKLMRRYEYYSNAVPSYFLTHPETDARIHYLDALIETSYGNQGDAKKYNQFKKIKILMSLDSGNYYEALKYYGNETKNNPTDSDAFYGLAMSQTKLGLLSQAIDSLQKAIKLAPNDEDILRELGTSYVKLGETARAFPYLQRAYEINAEDPDTISSLGKAYENMGNYDRARDLYQQALKKNPGSDEIYYDLAMTYGKMKNNGEYHYHFGIYFKKKNKQQSALFHFGEALKYFDKDPSKSQKIRDEMKSLRKK